MNSYKYKEIKIGLSQSFDAVITQKMMDDFLSMSADTNPLHTDREYAKEHGYPSQVVYGMLTASFYSTLVGVYLPGKFALLTAIDVSFNKPVFVEDKIKVFGEVSYMNDAFRQIEIKAYIENQDNVKVSKAKIKVGLYE